jgi:TRAP-type mannitol/chloroaromatic compound transport system permease small subunit
MIDFIGDALNWLAVGVLFPLTLLPLAGLVARRRSAAIGASIFAALVLAIAGAAILFAHLAPDLSGPELSAKDYSFPVALVLIAGVVARLGGPARASALLSPVAGNIARGAGRLTLVFVLLMALVEFALVVMRYVFGVNFIAMQESVTYLHGATFLIASGYALLTDDHVRVDIFYRGASEKRKALVDLAGSYLFLFPFCFVLLWATSPYVGASFAVREGSTEQSGIQGVYVLKSLIAAFAVLIALAGFAIAERSARRLAGARG